MGGEEKKLSNEDLQTRLNYLRRRADDYRRQAGGADAVASTFELELARRSLRATAELPTSELAFPYGDPTAEEIDEFRERLLVVADGLDRGDVGGWKCPGPANVLGVCVYDTENDGVQDHCLMCGQPDERK